MAKFGEGYETAIMKAKKSKSRTWVTKQKRRPQGHEYYHDDPVKMIPKIGNERAKALNKCGISTLLDCVTHPERMDNLTSEKETIVNAIKNVLDNNKINEGTCPNEIMTIDHRLAPNPFESKYGANWKSKIDKSPTMRLVNPISEMIRHMAQESSNALKGTKYEGKALFYHDALSQLTESKTVEWMQKNECEGRKLIDMWIRPVLGCNNEIVLSNGKKTNNYAGRPPGNSPEFMPLDTTLNQDIHMNVRTQVSATHFLPKDHKNKFSLATPKTIEHAYGRVHCPNYGDKHSAIPTSKRIVQDINKVFFSLLTVMKAKGRIVPGLASCSGHRAFLSAIARNEIVVDQAEMTDLLKDQPALTDDDKQTSRRWLHPDTQEAQKIRLKKKGKSEEE